MAAALRTGTALLALLVAACASETTPPPAEPASGPQAAAIKAPGGVWVVTELFPSGRMPPGLGPDSLVGQHVRLDGTEAGDVLGRTCATPAFRRVEITEAALLGGLQRAREFPTLRRPLTAVEVTCGEEPFGLYAAWKDGSLLARSAGLVVRLERAEAVPARMNAVPARMNAAPAPLPAAEPAPVAKSTKPAAATMVYLASYKSEKRALQGWDSLKKGSATLAGLKPATKPVDLGAKGRFVRLYAVAADGEQASQLCGEVKKQVPDCGARRG